jgi:hypothetical protein
VAKKLTKVFEASIEMDSHAMHEIKRSKATQVPGDINCQGSSFNANAYKNKNKNKNKPNS